MQGWVGWNSMPHAMQAVQMLGELGTPCTRAVPRLRPDCSQLAGRRRPHPARPPRPGCSPPALLLPTPARPAPRRFLRERTDLSDGATAFTAGAAAALGSSVVKVPLAVCIRSVQVRDVVLVPGGADRDALQGSRASPPAGITCLPARQLAAGPPVALVQAGRAPLPQLWCHQAAQQ